MKPEFGGLFCEKIFGPVNDFECSCQKFKKNQIKRKINKKSKKILFCPTCEVELTESKIRNYRMG